MTTLCEAAQRALEFCEFLWRDVPMNDYAEEQREAVETALRAALAEPEDSTTPIAEPVGWLEAPHGAFRANPNLKHEFPPQSLNWRIPLYALAEQNRAWYTIDEINAKFDPPQRKPLTDEENT